MLFNEIKQAILESRKAWDDMGIPPLPEVKSKFYPDYNAENYINPFSAYEEIGSSIPAVPLDLRQQEQAETNARVAEAAKERKMSIDSENNALLDFYFNTSGFKFSDIVLVCPDNQWIYDCEFPFIEWFRSVNKGRHLKLRDERVMILDVEADGYQVNRDVKIFAPLRGIEDRNEALKKAGFYERHANFQINWSISPALEAIKKEFVENFIVDGNVRMSYYFVGAMGTGKTTLMANLARILCIFLKSKIYYTTTTNLIKHIVSLESSSTKYVEQLRDAHILFIDDLALESITTPYQDANLRDFFCYRYSNNLTTIIAGNNDIRKIEDKSRCYMQLSDYMNDSDAYKVYYLGGESKRK